MVTDLYAAFSPAILEIEDRMGNLSPAYLMIEGKKAAQIDVEAFGDKKIRRFDIGSYVRRYFKRDMRQSNLFFDENMTGVFSPRLFQVKWVLATNMMEPARRGVMVNAVAQVGEDPDLNEQRRTFRTEFKRLRRYKGYELTVGCIGIIKADWGINPNWTVVTLKNAKGIDSLFDGSGTTDLSNHFVVVLNNKDYEAIQLGERRLMNGKIGAYLPIDNMSCTPTNPFYVRWVNQMGGYDYWMFGRRQVLTNKTENKKVFYPYVTDIKEVQTTKELYRFDVSESVVVGAEQLHNEDFEPLRKIIFSPLVEWYNEKTKRWTIITVADYDFEYNTAKSCQDIEITFNLPDKQLQF